jgi:decaprenyl-phosphate phosphoribosyltransferase
VLLRACRPRQWLKNGLVALAPAAAGTLTRAATLEAVLETFVAFCLLSSATYLLNDVRDRAEDRRHPRKQLRPVAAGELSPRGALRIALILAILGFACAVAVSPLTVLIAVCYIALTTSYSLWWRRLVVLDIVAVAAGFLLRAVAGAAAANVPLSRAFLIVTSACALFLVAGKRYAELRDRHARGRARAALARYSRTFLLRLLVGAATLGCGAYVWWAFGRPEPEAWFELSTVPFVTWLVRYGVMLGRGAGEAPEELVLRDRTLLSLAALWLVLFVGGTYGAR